MERSGAEQPDGKNAGSNLWWQIPTLVALLAGVIEITVGLKEIVGWFNNDSDEVAVITGDNIKLSKDAVLVGHNRAEIRVANGVRRMLELEERQVVSRLTQVYGFANYVFTKQALDEWNRGRAASDEFSVRLSGEQSRTYGVELHVLEDGRVMVLVCVSDGDAARLSDPDESPQEVFGFYLDCSETRPVLVGIPISRIRGWELRTTDFGVIHVD